MAGFKSTLQLCNLKVVFFICVIVTLILIQNSRIVKYIARLINQTDISNFNRRPHKNLIRGHQSPRPTRKPYTPEVANSCPTSTFPADRLKPETWQTVGPNNSILVYSAYLEARDPEGLTIIGLSEKNVSSNHYCQLWYKTNEWDNEYDVVVSRARINMLHDSLLRYTSCAIKCSIPTRSTPSAVSLVSGLACSQADNVLKITHVPKVQKYALNFTVCLSPLHFWYDRVYDFVGWIELNLILGANNFLVYNYSSSANVVSVLEYYKSKNLVDVIQWRPPIQVDETVGKNEDLEVHYYAQTACLNDCLFRSRGVSEFIVVLDLDEFIIPHGKKINTWKDVISRVPTAGAYLFKNSFFPIQRKKMHLDFPGKELAKKYKLSLLLNVCRERKISDGGDRSKYIARTSATRVVLTHVTISDRNMRVVHPTLAFLHHYRYWPMNQTQDLYVRDKTVINKYSKQLIERVCSTLADLGNAKVGFIKELC